MTRNAMPPLDLYDYEGDLPSCVSTSLGQSKNTDENISFGESINRSFCQWTLTLLQQTGKNRG